MAKKDFEKFENELDEEIAFVFGTDEPEYGVRDRPYHKADQEYQGYPDEWYEWN